MYTRALLENPLTRPALRKDTGSQYLQPGLVVAIVAHWTANLDPGANAIRNRNYFNNGSPDAKGRPRAASAHYIVDSEQVVQCIPETEIAFHCGDKPLGRYTDLGNQIRGKNPTPNYRTVGFEMCVNADGDFSQMRGRSVSLAAQLLLKHGLSIHELERHWDITGKKCPAFYVPEGPNAAQNVAAWIGFCAAVRNELYTLEITHQRARVIPPELNLRAAPNANAPILGVLVRNEPVVYQRSSMRGNWAEVWPGHWVNARFLETF